MDYMEQGFAVREILPHIIDCTRELFKEGSTATDTWIFITNEALYYIFPVILTIGVIFSVINTIITAKMAADSHECYLTAFNLCCCLFLIASCILQLPNYVRSATVSEYSMILPYLPAVESWLWYSCTWLLITIVTERTAHSLCGKWHASFGRIHGILVSLLIMIIAFVSTLPQYWEYELSQIADNHGNHNCTRQILVPRPGVLTPDGKGYIPEYGWFHWYQLLASIGLPYLVLPMLLPPLICVKMHIYTSMPTTNGKAGSMKYTMGTSMKDQLRQERSFNRLIFTMSVLYLVMSAPRNVLRLFQTPPIGLPLSDNDLLLSTIQILFEAIFYLFFSLLFFFYLGFGNKFRTTLYHLCCCKKQDPMDYY